jgi:ABC-type transport system involved in multi-copper enzyme maturation permease subunit
MPPALIIARLTIFEAIRRRVVLTVLILTPIVIGATGWGFSKLTHLTGDNGAALAQSEVRLNQAVLLILIAFMFSVVMAIGAAFLAAPSLANDIESGLLLAMLPRPIRRADVVLGKWLGLAIPLVGYAFTAGGIELEVVKAACGYVAPEPTRAIAFIAAQSLILLTITLALSTRLAPMASGIIVVVLFGAGWIIGLAQTIGQTFHNQAIANAGTVFSLIFPSDVLWRGAVSALEPAAVVAAGARVDPLVTSSSPAAAYQVWAALWGVGVLAVTVYSFARREL